MIYPLSPPPNSGAGKTVSAKYIMRYFATADDQESVGKKKKASGSGMTEVEEQILGKSYHRMRNKRRKRHVMLIILHDSNQSDHGSFWQRQDD